MTAPASGQREARFEPMTGLVMRVLKKLGIAPAFSDNEVIEASIEDSLRDHSKVVGEFIADATNRQASNARLRAALQLAKLRTSEFADLEVAMKGRRGRGKHATN